MEALLKYTLGVMLCFFFYINANAFPEKQLNIPLHSGTISLNPSDVQDISSLWVSRQINCQLFRMRSSRIVPEAASSVKYINPTKILIHLNPKATFNDGSPVTASDVVASFMFIKKSRLVFRGIFSWVKKVKAINAETVVIQLFKPYSEFLTILATPNYAIFKKTFIDAAKKNPLLWKYPVTCGNYKLVANTKSWVDLEPRGKGLPIRFYLLRTNEITKKELSQYDISDLAITNDHSGNIKNFRIVKVFDPYQIYFGLNTKKHPWNIRKNRCSLMSKLNFKNVIKAYGAGSQQATDIIPPGILGYKNTFAENRLIFGKYDDIETRKKGKFCLTFLSVSIPNEYHSVYVRSIESLYPSVTTKVINNTKHFGKTFLNMNCDAIVLGLKSNTLDAYGILDAFTKTDSNFTGYSNKRVTREIRSSQLTMNQRKKYNQYRDIITRIEKACIIYPVLVTKYRKIYINKSLLTPGIGKVPLDNYYLGQARWKKA